MAEPVEEIDETVEAMRQILVNVYMRVTAASTGQRPTDLTDEERTGVLERWAPFLADEAAMLEELARQCRIEGASGLYQGLRESVLDPEVVQEVIEHSELMAAEDG